MKQKNFFKMHFIEVLFIVITVVLAIFLWYTAEFVQKTGIALFGELLAAQILTRKMVSNQVRYPEHIRKSYPRAAALSISGFTVLSAVILVSSLQEEYWWPELVWFVALYALFILLYKHFSSRDARRYRRLEQMSARERDRELKKVHQALADIERARRVLDESPLY